MKTETPKNKIHAWTNGVPVEAAAQAQIDNVAALSFVKHVAVMPDVHWGMGATIGSVIATDRVIIPAAVGVDLGCGMQALMTGLTASQLPDNLAALRTAIEERVPHGRTDNGQVGDKGAWTEDNTPERVIDSGVRMVGSAPGIISVGRMVRQLGTLGTGNHFIEVCLDEAQRVWIMLHSGSRGAGNAIGRYFIEKAKEEMQRWHVHLPDGDLAYLPEDSQHFNGYVNAVNWAQNYAKVNRNLMMIAVLDALGSVGMPTDWMGSVEDCHHNYVQRENHFGQNLWVTRKGAVSAREGQIGIIPGSMGAKSFIVRGKGHPGALMSCSHGAGRAMSRTAARKQFTLADHAAATAGVECRKDIEVIDETPAAYKDIDAVMAAQSDLVEVLHTLKQVLCVKG